MTCIILHNLQNTNLQTLLKNSVLQFSNKSMFESEWQTKKIDLNYYVNNHQ